MVKKLTLKDCKDFAKSKGGKCLSTRYESALDKNMLWKCNCGVEWKTSFSSLKNQGTWCPKCSVTNRLTLKDCKNFAKFKGWKCLSKEYIGVNVKIDWMCDKGHFFEKDFHSAKRGVGCKQCYFDSMRYSLEDCQKLANKKKGKCLSKRYVDCSSKLKWECDKGHKWETTYSRIHQGSWCPYCSEGKSEEEVRRIFKKIFNKEFLKIRPFWLINPKTGYSLELDGFCEEVGIAFEYDGEQHFRRVDFIQTEYQFLNQKFKDKIKDDLCKKNGVKLIRIPHTVKFKELEKYIVEKLK